MMNVQKLTPPSPVVCYFRLFIQRKTLRHLSFTVHCVGRCHLKREKQHHGPVSKSSLLARDLVSQLFVVGPTEEL